MVCPARSCTTGPAGLYTRQAPLSTDVNQPTTITTQLLLQLLSINQPQITYVVTTAVINQCIESTNQAVALNFAATRMSHKTLLLQGHA